MAGKLNLIESLIFPLLSKAYCKTSLIFSVTFTSISSGVATICLSMAACFRLHEQVKIKKINEVEIKKAVLM
jgi:hypothetical protein